jgi:hypothetical protein
MSKGFEIERRRKQQLATEQQQREQQPPGTIQVETVVDEEMGANNGGIS